MRLLELYQILDEESELLFELRNVLNVDELKKWAGENAHYISAGFRGPLIDTIYPIVVAWAQKALLKHAVNEMPGDDVGPSADPNKVYIGNDLHQISELPPWAQQAIKRRETLTWVVPDRVSIKYPRRIAKDLQVVRDWLRFKYQQNPREFTQNRLARIPWAEAVRLGDEYHAKLAVEQEKFATIKDVENWWRRGGMDDTGSTFHWDAIVNVNSLKQKAMRAFEKATGRKVIPPKDDPHGHEPYIQYHSGGGIMEPAEKIPTRAGHLDLKWDEQPGDDGWEPEDVGKKDFVPAPEIGEQWVKLKSEQCVKYEGEVMGHCVGSYGREVEEDSVWIYSYRDTGNEPHVTIEVLPDMKEAGKFPTDPVEVQQIKGKQNKPPTAKYHSKVIDFLKKIHKQYDVSYEEEAHLDLLGMGMFVNGEGDNTSISMFQPPFDMDKFARYEVVQDPPEEDEDGYEDWPESEVTDEERGNLSEIISGSGYDLEDYMHDIINTIINTRGGCWEDEREGQYGGFNKTEICYVGPDRSADRKKVRVL